MAIWDQNNSVPVVPGNSQQTIEHIVRAGRNRKIDVIPGNHVSNLVRGSLVQIQIDLRILLPELTDDTWKHIARLGIGRCNGQRAFPFPVEICSKAPDLFDLVHDFARSHDNLLPGAGHPIEALTFAAEELQTQFFLQQFQLFADTGLRGVQAIGCGRYIQAIIDYR